MISPEVLENSKIERTENIRKDFWVFGIQLCGGHIKQEGQLYPFFFVLGSPATHWDDKYYPNFYRYELILTLFGKPLINWKGGKYENRKV